MVLEIYDLDKRAALSLGGLRLSLAPLYLAEVQSRGRIKREWFWRNKLQFNFHIQLRL